ncbi:MAG: bi-domain-containing oxidoreductase [Cytobacillus gottheilii]|uniref:bi-domain-containing oxidoreductase n=1 Tax=Cytobacillus gottheilii TaxID=859144 RepID=UPI003463BFCE
MKQVVVSKGNILVDDYPAKVVSDNSIIVKVVNSCISAGTEMSVVNESKKSLIKRAIEQPEKAKKAVKKILTDGLSVFVSKISDINEGSELGYSASGVIVEVGEKVQNFKVGDRVACVGAGVANHAEYIEVPVNLTVPIPNNVNFEDASTVALGSIAMQGVRRTAPQLGETVVVYGLGILGQITVQLLNSAGCKTIGIDIDNKRLKVAKENGCHYIINALEEDVVKYVSNITKGFGSDSVIITAATSTNDVLSNSFNMCRQKGKVVLVGVVGKEFSREDMYRKELDFLIATSYGPGRYDENYENKGMSYPYAYVRWTENRNMQSYLELINEDKVKLSNLIEKIYKVTDAKKAYDEYLNGTKPLIVLLEYKNVSETPNHIQYNSKIEFTKQEGVINVAIVGAGSYARGMHLPNLSKLQDKYKVYAIVSRNGTNATNMAKRYNAQYGTTDYKEVLRDKNVDLVMITTRHNLHAEMALEALENKKMVFVEKPLALSGEDAQNIIETAEKNKMLLTVGFNRRFSKYMIEVKKHLSKRISPVILNYRMNAGYIPYDHWVHTNEGGGRIIGEACHIFDLFNYLTDSMPKSISVNSVNDKEGKYSNQDNAFITVTYEDGSICNLLYTSMGNESLPKENLEVYFDGKTIIVDDYKEIMGFGVKVENIKTKTSDKGQLDELVELYESIQKGKKPIEYNDLISSNHVSLLANRLLKE